MSAHPMTIALCQHIKTNGVRCGSPALRNHKLCYFHDRWRPLIQHPSGTARFPSAPFFLPLLEDADSIQIALSKVCGHLLHRRLDPQKAGILLHAIQLASTNLKRRNQTKARENRVQHEAALNEIEQILSSIAHGIGTIQCGPSK
jgi:hypothetical protein